MMPAAKKMRLAHGQTMMPLNTGASMPLLGLGTWKSKPGEVENAVKVALDNGYKHIDCAAVYGNEKEVGNAFAAKVGSDGVIKREDLFVTSKLWNSNHARERVVPALKQTLADLQLDYLDLYLIHWPHGFKNGDDKFPKDDEGNILFSDTHYTETWRGMEECVKLGLTRAIGLSNFNSVQIQTVFAMKDLAIEPAVLQIESHPYCTQEKLIEFARSKGMQVTGYSPLGSPDRPWAKEGEPHVLEDPQIAEIAKKHGKTPAQICIKFQAQRGVVVIPKSVTPARIIANHQVHDFELSDEEMDKIASFNRDWRACNPMIEKGGVMVPRDLHHPHFPFQPDLAY